LSGLSVAIAAGFFGHEKRTENPAQATHGEHLSAVQTKHAVRERVPRIVGMIQIAGEAPGRHGIEGQLAVNLACQRFSVAIVANRHPQEQTVTLRQSSGAQRPRSEEGR
jgi:hypothetical protein